MTTNPYDIEDTCTCSAWSPGECGCGGYVDLSWKRRWQEGYDAASADLAAVTKDRDIYKDAFKDATMANTVAAKNLAEQEAKTVEYRAAWIKATRERDDARKRLRETRAGLRELTEGLCECGDVSCTESAFRVAISEVTE